MKKLLTLFLLLFTILEAKYEHILLDFEGINSTPSPVGSFYNAKYGIIFDDHVGAYSHNDYDFSNEPSSETIIFSFSTFSMTKSSGFTGTLSFYYSNNKNTSVTIFDASNNILSSVTIGSTGNTDPNAPNSWKHISLSFNGNATHVKFGGDTLYDNIRLGSVDVPALSDALKLLLGLLLAFISIKHLYRKKYV